MTNLSDVSSNIQGYINQSNTFVDQSATLTAITSGTPGAGQFLSTIIGRAAIPDITNDFRASFGIERIMTQQIQLVQNESGPNGEPVYSTPNDTNGLIRFVGNWGSINDSYGVYIQNPLSDSTSYVEITFYGTGLNFLSFPGNNSAVTYIADGGANGSGTLSNTAGGSNILGNRNYSDNVVFSVISGKNLGIHTVKLNNTSRTVVYGFEVLNENTSSLNINPGTSYYRGQRIKNNIFDSIAYTTGVTGTKGGRIVRYFTSDDTPNQVFTPVNSSIAYGASADHTNEEVVRTYYPREFSAGRYTAADDFSTLVGGGRANTAFTLDDGTTTLVAYYGAMSVLANSTEGLFHVQNGAFFTFTFVGCGLDVVLYDNQAGSNGATDYQYQIDGGTATNWFYTTANTLVRTQKVVSGLSYGTHTFTVTRNAATGFAPWFVAFRVYQPKKPILPTNAAEICDYNVMGAFTANTTPGINTIAKGVLRKQVSQREGLYSGAWTMGTITPSSYMGGWEATTSNGFFYYTFFGTGFEFRSYANNGGGGVNGNVLLQNLSTGGSLLVASTSNFPSIVYSSYSSGWSISNGSFSAGSAVYGSGFSISGLPLALWYIEMYNTGPGTFQVGTVDVITPIHVYKHNIPAVLQNTLAIGSQGLTDSRATSTTSKAWAQTVGVSSAATSSTTPSPCMDMSCAVKTSGGPLQVNYKLLYIMSGGTLNAVCQVYIDGSAVGVLNITTATGGAGYYNELSDSLIVPVTAGFHKVDLYWWANTSGTVNSAAAYRNMTVREL